MELINLFLLPPFNLLLIAAAGLCFWHKRPVIAQLLLSTSIILLWLLGTPHIAAALLLGWEGETRVVDTARPSAEAIVVLGGGSYFHAPEYGMDTVNPETLVRLRFAAKLQRETAKPILVTGGAPQGTHLSEAVQMKQVLEQEFRVPVQWKEGASNNTLESAILTRQQLKQAGVERIYLVTHAWHMPRAAYAFESAGFQVVPAPTAYTRLCRSCLRSFIPNVSALRDSRIFVHELIGLFWYRLKFWQGMP